MINFILLILAIILFSILAPIGFIYAMFFSGRKAYFLQVAIAIDQHGNAVCGKLLSLLLIKKDGFGFGNVDRTISFVIGINNAIAPSCMIIIFGVSKGGFRFLDTL